MTNVSKKTMLKALQETEFPKNTGRTNVLKGKQTYSYSMVLGKVRVMFKPKGTFAPSRHNKKHANLLKMAKQFLKQHDPSYRFHAVRFQQRLNAPSKLSDYIPLASLHDSKVKPNPVNYDSVLLEL